MEIVKNTVELELSLAWNAQIVKLVKLYVILFRQPRKPEETIDERQALFASCGLMSLTSWAENPYGMK
jgi:hypothetical protein